MKTVGRWKRNVRGSCASCLRNSLAFAGAKMIRRILGLAHVEDLEAIADPERRARCEAKALQLARELLVRPKVFPASPTS